MTAVDVDALVRHLKSNPVDAIEVAYVKFPRSFYSHREYSIHLREDWAQDMWNALYYLGPSYGVTFSEDDDYFLETEDESRPVIGMKKEDVGKVICELLSDWDLERMAAGWEKVPERIMRAIAQGKSAASKSRKPSSGARKAPAKRTTATRKPATKRRTTGARR